MFDSIVNKWSKKFFFTIIVVSLRLFCMTPKIFFLRSTNRRRRKNFRFHLDQKTFFSSFYFWFLPTLGAVIYGTCTYGYQYLWGSTYRCCFVQLLLPISDKEKTFVFISIKKTFFFLSILGFCQLWVLLCMGTCRNAYYYLLVLLAMGLCLKVLLSIGAATQKRQRKNFRFHFNQKTFFRLSILGFCHLWVLLSMGTCTYGY